MKRTYEGILKDHSIIGDVSTSTSIEYLLQDFNNKTIRLTIEEIE